MDFLSNLAMGFQAVSTFSNVGLCLVGVLVGTLIGVLPGLGSVATIALLLPMTFGLEPLSALIMLAGIYYGAQYGGSTTAILVNLPGESSSVVTCIDGYKMALQGRAGSALAVAALGSLFAGCVGTLLIGTFGPALASFSQSFGAAEYFSIMLLGLIAAVVLANGSLIKALAMIVLGLLFGLAGTDLTTGVVRYTFGIPSLSDGVDFVVVAMGVFGLAEIMVNLERSAEQRQLVTGKVRNLWPSRAEFRQAWPAVIRGTALGSALGVLPGGGATISSFGSYTIEKKLAKDPSRFGNGAVEGVAGPEAANNAAAQAQFIPLLTLGLPTNAVMALMVGAMMMHGITPGPRVIQDQPVLFWGLVASMWIGNLMLVIINLPLISVWVWLLKVPYRVLFPIILVVCCIGVYTINKNPVDLGLTAVFAILGFVFVKLDCERAPFLLGFILGPLMELYLRRALLLSQGDAMVFVTRPLSLAILLVAAGLLLVIILPAVRKTREEVFEE